MLTYRQQMAAIACDQDLRLHGDGAGEDGIVCGIAGQRLCACRQRGDLGQRAQRVRVVRDRLAIGAQLPGEDADELLYDELGDDQGDDVVKDALRDRCSVGEVCGAMRDVFGEYQPTF